MSSRRVLFDTIPSSRWLIFALCALAAFATIADPADSILRSDSVLGSDTVPEAD